MAETSAAAENVIAEWARLKSERGTFESHWQQVTRYCQPYRADYTVERAPGAKRMQYVLNGTPILASTELAAGLHGLMCSPYLPWKYVEAEEDYLNQRDDVQRWWFAVNQAMDRCFSGARGAFPTAAHEFLLDTVLTGPGCMALPADEANGVHFQCHSMREICIDEDANERVDTIYRQYELNARQAVGQWGDAAPAKVREAADKTPGKKFKFIHACRPRKVRDPQRADARNMPVESINVCLDTKEQIDEGGYNENIFIVARHEKLSHDKYGEGRGTVALPDIKELQERERALSLAAQLAVKPPMSYGDDSYRQRIRFLPGALNPHAPGTPQADQLRPIMTGVNVPIGVEMVDRMEQRILRLFYVDWLLMPGNLGKPQSDGKGITATYTQIERDQKMRLLSPLLGRYESEFLGPVVNRVFQALFRLSKIRRFNPALGAPFPTPPEVLRGKKWHVRYVSPIAVAQRSAALDSVQRLLQFGAGLAQFDPQGVQGLIDAEGTFRYAGQVMHVAPMVIKSAQEVQALRAEQAQQAQADRVQQTVETAAKGAAGIKSVAQAANAVAPLAGAGTPTGSRSGIAQPGLLAA